MFHKVQQTTNYNISNKHDNILENTFHETQQSSENMTLHLKWHLCDRGHLSMLSLASAASEGRKLGCRPVCP